MRAVVLLIALWCVPHVCAFGDSFRYEFPRSLEITLSQESSTASGPRTVMARLEARLGTLSDLQLYVTSSPDIRVEGLASAVPSLKSGEVFTCTLTVQPGDGTPDDLGTWIKLGVNYLPDYPAVLDAVSNVASFPDHGERQRMIDVAKKNAVSKKPYADACRLFLDSR